MLFLSTRAHGVIDYAVGLLLIALPFLLGFANGGPAQWVPTVLGVSAIGYSLLTRYELGLVHVISMPVHLGLDTASGALLLASPWLFDFADQVWAPHLVIGLAEIGVAAFTRTTTTLTAEGLGRERKLTRIAFHGSRTIEQLRDDIDHGLTGDKVNAPDPASAPLGADDEAAGVRIHPMTDHLRRLSAQENLTRGTRA